MVIRVSEPVCYTPPSILSLMRVMPAVPQVRQGSDLSDLSGPDDEFQKYGVDSEDVLEDGGEDREAVDATRSEDEMSRRRREEEEEEEERIRLAAARAVVASHCGGAVASGGAGLTLAAAAATALAARRNFSTGTEATGEVNGRPATAAADDSLGTASIDLEDVQKGRPSEEGGVESSAVGLKPAVKPTDDIGEVRSVP
jgi:hypothetical protein